MANSLFNESGAIFSECRKYRYKLWRYWDESKPIIVFIGLNPSTANETTNDPTIMKVQKIAKNLGYGGVHMLNLFAIISSKPEVLLTCSDPIGENDKYLAEAKDHDVVFAWGAFKQATERARVVIDMFDKAQALKINADGSPKHPLYCRDNTIPVNFK